MTTQTTVAADYLGRIKVADAYRDAYAAQGTHGRLIAWDNAGFFGMPQAIVEWDSMELTKVDSGHLVALIDA